MNQIKTDYGIKEVQFGNLTVYTAKIRFQGIQYTPDNTVLKVAYTTMKGKSYCTISYETTLPKVHEHYSQVLGRLCQEIAQHKLNKRYGWVK